MSKNFIQLQNLYKSYCSNHPKAVQVLQNSKSVGHPIHNRTRCSCFEENDQHDVVICCCRDVLSAFMESAGAPAPGVRYLTTSLSLPFGLLDKYPNLLKEVERHIDTSHVDRGDTQRAMLVYHEIAVRLILCTLKVQWNVCYCCCLHFRRSVPLFGSKRNWSMN